MQNDSFWTKIIFIISGVISLAVGFLILGPRPEGMNSSLDVSFLPKLNASINGFTTLLLILGFILILQKKRDQHKIVMLTAFGASSLFLVSYVIYHWFKSGPKLYTGEFTTIYYFILLTHIVLAIIIIPMALFTLYRGWSNQLNKHRKIARITLPIWLYVSISGVIIYLMLYL
jgi:putative membrane protein